MYLYILFTEIQNQEIINDSIVENDIASDNMFMNYVSETDTTQGIHESIQEK